MHTTDMAGTPAPGGPPVPVYLGNGWVQLLSTTVYYGHNIAIGIFGASAFSLQVPDGAVSGGNARGANSVDLQTIRSTAAKVASGVSSTISGGAGNTASGISTTVCGGSNNTASGMAATVVGGEGNTASSSYSLAGGYASIASGTFAAAFGRSNTASGDTTFAAGFGNTASGGSSWVPGGYQATTRGLFGAGAHSAGQRAALGDAQILRQPVRTTTSSTTLTPLSTDGAAPAATTVMVLPNNSSLTGQVMVSARDSTTGAGGSWLIFFRVSRGANAASTAVDFQTQIHADAGALAATVAVAADTTLGALVVNFTAPNSNVTDVLAEPINLQIVR